MKIIIFHEWTELKINAYSVLYVGQIRAYFRFSSCRDTIPYTSVWQMVDNFISTFRKTSTSASQECLRFSGDRLQFSEILANSDFLPVETPYPISACDKWSINSFQHFAKPQLLLRRNACGFPETGFNFPKYWLIPNTERRKSDKE